MFVEIILIKRSLLSKRIDPGVYKGHLELMEIALDVEKIAEGLNRVRNKKR